MRSVVRPLLLTRQQDWARRVCPQRHSCLLRFRSDGGNCMGSAPPHACSSSHPILASQGVSSSTASAGVETETVRAPSTRDRAVERLSWEVFARGNQHLKNVETLTSLPEGLHSFPEVCFIGKPSCGKSSLISCLLHNRRLGKTGKVRGTTRLLQFFNVGDALLLVDTPGYGGWRGRQLDLRPRDRANAFAILFRYLALRKGGALKRVYWCVEASATTPMALGPRDEEIFAFLQREHLPFTVVLTKLDRHWHHYREQTRQADTIGKDGTPRAAAWRRLRQRQRRLRGIDDDVGGREFDDHAVPPILTPAEGVRRNMAEICHFLGSAEVPIIGVSANRWHPERSMNLEALQHDIVDHCVRELPAEADLTFDKLHELSYAPPRAEDVERVQLTYPVEAFVVPQDDQLSLQEMVDRHENAKAHLLTQSARFNLLSAADARGGYLEDSRRLQAQHEMEDSQRAQLAELPPTLSIGSRVDGVSLPRLSGSPDGGVQPVVQQAGSRPGKKAFRVRALLRGSSDEDDWWRAEAPAGRQEERPERSGEGTGAPRDDRGIALVPAASEQPTFAASSAPPRAVTPMPFSLDREAQTVTAINGVRIPRSLVPSSVEDLAIEKEDEMPAFAAKSGAGAYEEMLIHDHMHPESPEALMFTETSPAARLSESALDAAPRPRTKSAARKQEERLLRKFVDRGRKARSVYMQAEGYMNPWAGQSGEAGRGRLGTVVGLPATSHAPTGRSGALMKGLKKSGFGGKSYSARTLRGKGRATTKTGSWAA